MNRHPDPDYVAGVLVARDDERAWRESLADMDDAFRRALAYTDAVGLSDGTDRPTDEAQEALR